MVRFSIIVAVYNVERYIEKCLESISKQTYDNYEVLIINDGSKDGSQGIIDKFVKKDRHFKSFIKKNGGLSDARNYGVKKAKGDYLLFVDGDDTINSDLLKSIDDCLSIALVDLVRFGISKVFDDGSFEKDVCDQIINTSGVSVFPSLLKHPFFVTAVSYAYSKDFWNKNKFEYSFGRVHEDFGLTPYIVVKATSMSIIEYVGYNYYYRSDSIMGNNEMEKLRKKNIDSLYFFDLHMERIELLKIDDYSKKIYRSYIANALINRCVLLDGKMLDDYLGELKLRKAYSYLLNDTLVRKMKKLACKLMPKLYIKFFVK